MNSGTIKTESDPAVVTYAASASTRFEWKDLLPERGIRDFVQAQGLGLGLVVIRIFKANVLVLDICSIGLTRSLNSRNKIGR